MLEILVNGNYIDISEEVNVRLNKRIYDPSKINQSQEEYSFSFNLPITPTNQRVFDYANIVEKSNKFTRRYETTVYSDGKILFNGTLRISSIADNYFKCNLVVLKQNSLEDIFGEDKLNVLNWDADYDGIESVNETNADSSTKYFFPLIGYGAFQKIPKEEYNSGQIKIYSGRYEIDDTNLFYYSSFLPSANYLEVVKRLFNQYGYQVYGDVINNQNIKPIYLSTSLGEKQDLKWPYGKPKFGSCKVKWNWQNRYRGTGRGTTAGIVASQYNLTHRYDLVDGKNFNLDCVNVWDIWMDANRNDYRKHTEDTAAQTYKDWNLWIDHDGDNLWRENCIIVPTDGLYKITLKANMELVHTQDETASVWVSGEEERQDRKLGENFTDKPIELHLVRNTANMELIHGYDGQISSVYPHEKPTPATQLSPDENPQPTQDRGDASIATGSTDRDRSNNWRGSGNAIGRNESETVIGDTETEESLDGEIGYLPLRGYTMAYDAWVNPDFICGFSTIGSCPSTIKSGYSWNSRHSEKQYSKSNVEGYYNVTRKNGIDWMEWTDYNKDSYPEAPNNYFYINSDTKATGSVTVLTWLNKNDVLMLKAVQQSYKDSRDNLGIPIQYTMRIDGEMSIEAYSPYKADLVDARYKNDTKFNKNLNIGDFLNEDVKISDFIQTFINTFNLSYSQIGNVVYLNSNKMDFSDNGKPIEMDNRVAVKDLTISKIDYPKNIEIKFTNSSEEEGFYKSVPYNKVELKDWENYADIGSEKVPLTNDEDAQDLSTTINMSYNWYGDYKLSMDGQDKNITIPVIAKSELMIDNYKDDEAMDDDGLSHTIRMWYRGEPTTDYVVTNSGEKVYITTGVEKPELMELSFNNKPNTILTNFFNIKAWPSSDIVEFEAYLSTEEYLKIKKGTSIRLNSDRYIVIEIQGFDCNGKNRTKIKAQKIV